MAKLFVIQALIVDGNALPIDDSSVTLENPLGYEREAVPSGTGEHGSTTKRVVPVIKGKVQFGAGIQLKTLDFCDAQVVLAEANTCAGQTPKRMRMTKVETAKTGEIGSGSVDLELNVLGRVEEV
jgi:hypothetical protein